jgi:hypothetical protein
VIITIAIRQAAAATVTAIVVDGFIAPLTARSEHRG